MPASSKSPFILPKCGLPEENALRGIVWLNGEWDFAPQAEYALPKESEWSKVKIRIPSPWNVNAFSEGNGPGGDFIAFTSYPKEWNNAAYGWHKRAFSLTPEQTAGKRVILHFEAVMYEAEVYVNGQLVGSHGDGFLPFEFDVTDMVKPGKNELLVGVRNADHLRENGRIIYPTGSFWGQGIRGIWQDVYLRVLPETYIDDVYVTTSVRQKKINVEATVANMSDKPATLAVKFALRPAKGTDKAVPAIPPKTITLGPGETKTLKASAAWASPKLWAPESPFLYYLDTTLAGQKAVDRLSTRFGFREFWIEGPRFVLNGQPIKMRGDAWHFMGVPQMTEEYARRWYEAARATDINLVRLHAQVYPRFYYDIADEMGMLLVDENANWASHCGYQYNEHFWQKARQHTIDWVKRNRNHPSVIIWSVDNEFAGAHGVQPNDGAPTLDWLFEQVGLQLVSAIQQYDTTRPISADGDDDQNGRLAIRNQHYCGIDPSPGTYGVKPITIGEIGPMYFATPEQEARFIGGTVYERFANRLKAIGIEMSWQTQNHRKWVEYTAPFNMVWYSLLPQKFSGQKWSYPSYDGPGMNPDRVGPYTSTLNAGFDSKSPPWRPNTFYPYLRDSFITRRFFFDDRSVNFYSGAKVERKITVHNDIHRPATMRVDIRVTQGRKTVFADVKDLKMPAAGMETIKFSFKVPEVASRAALRIKVSMTENRKPVFSQTQICSVFPHRMAAPEVTVLGDGKALLSALTDAGITHTVVDNVSSVPDGKPLLVNVSTALGQDDKDALMSRVRAGLRVAFFGDIPWVELGWKERDVSSERAFPSNPAHPIFKGLSANDLQCWAGGGVRVVNRVYETILPPNARALMFCENGQVAIYEQRVGKGRIIGCGAEIAKAKQEPVAVALMCNIIKWAAAAPDASRPNAPTVFLGQGRALKGIINGLGVDYSEDPSTLSAAKLLILDGRRPIPANVNPEDLSKFVKSGGKALVWELAPDALDGFNKAFGLSVRLVNRPRDVLVRAIQSCDAPKGETSVIFCEGALEIEPNGSGWIRPEVVVPSPSDALVAPEIIKKRGLKSGDVITGWARTPAWNEKTFVLTRVDSVNNTPLIDPLLVGIDNTDLFWIQPGSSLKVAEYSVEVNGGQVLIKSPAVDWHKWMDNPENIKTSAVAKSEANPPAATNALVRLPYGKGEIIFSEIVARGARSKSRRVISTILENLGAPMTRERVRGMAQGVDEEGYIFSWLISGTYSEEGVAGNDLGHDWLGGEADVVPKAGDKWRVNTNTSGSTVNFHGEDLFPGVDQAAAYAAVYVWSPKSGEVLLDSPELLQADFRVGSDDGVKVWLNGKVVWENPAFRPMVDDNDIVRDVKLAAGWNLLLVKIGQSVGEWQFVARFTDPYGDPIPELKYSTDAAKDYKKQ